MQDTSRHVKPIVDPDISRFIENQRTKNSMNALPECFENYGDVYHNGLINPNPCIKCRKYDSCSVAVASRIATAKQDPTMQCLGDAEVYDFESSKCRKCVSRLMCSSILLEGLERQRQNDALLAKSKSKTAVNTPIGAELGFGPADPGYGKSETSIQNFPIASIEMQVNKCDLEKTAEVSVGSSTGAPPQALQSPHLPRLTAEASDVKDAQYRFPDISDEFRRYMPMMRGKQASKLLRFIDIVSQMREASDFVGYLEIRDRFCAASIALNEKKIHPPRFRNVRRLRMVLKAQSARRLPWETLLLNDRQVIDLHWLYVTQAVRKPHSEYRGLFEGVEFDFELASQLAAYPQPASKKVESGLRLPMSQQLLLSVMQSRAAYDRWRTIEEGADSVVATLEAEQQNRKARLSRGNAEIMEDAFYALKIADESPRAACDYFTLINGTAVDAWKLANCKKWLKERGLM